MAHQEDILTKQTTTSPNGNSQNKKIVLNKETIYAVLDYFPKFGNRKFLDDDLNLQDQINESLGKAKGIRIALHGAVFTRLTMCMIGKILPRLFSLCLTV